HTRFSRDWSSDVCSSDLIARIGGNTHLHLTHKGDGPPPAVSHGRLAGRRRYFLRIDWRRCADRITTAHSRLDHTGVVDPVAVVDGTFPAGGIDGIADVTRAVIDNRCLAGVGNTQRPQQQQDSVESIHNSDPLVVMGY